MRAGLLAVPGLYPQGASPAPVPGGLSTLQKYLAFKVNICKHNYVLKPILLMFLLLPCAAASSILGFSIHPTTESNQLRYQDQILTSGGFIHCQEQRLALLKHKFGFGRVNIIWSTLGGKQYWADHFILDGWRIQQHVATKHFRLLDPRDRRHAWGSYESCRCKLAHLRFAKGMGTKIETEAVVLLHGIVRSKESMKKVKTAIEAHGYEVLDINYPSRKGQIADFANQVHALLNKRPDITRVSFVTHSMGGLIVRKMFETQKEAWQQRTTVKRVVMLFPPNQGAYKANRWAQKHWYRCVMGPAGVELCSDYVQALPGIPVDCGIIIGAQGNGSGKSFIIPGDDDGTVGVEECKLDGVTDYAYHAVGHTYGMNKAPVIEDIVSYLERAAFVSVPEPESSH